MTSAADHFSISYSLTYKVLTQTNANFKAVLYQCGTPKPTTGDLGFTPDLYVSVPVTKVAFTSSRCGLSSLTPYTPV